MMRTAAEAAISGTFVMCHVPGRTATNYSSHPIFHMWKLTGSQSTQVRFPSTSPCPRERLAKFLV